METKHNINDQEELRQTFENALCVGPYTYGQPEFVGSKSNKKKEAKTKVSDSKRKCYEINGRTYSVNLQDDR
jgi:hypothetical protein